MKITIDTKEDSPDDIRKVMQILSHFAGSTALSNYSSGNGEQGNANVDSTSMMNLFGDDSASTGVDNNPRTSERDSGTLQDFSSFLNLTTKKAEKKEEIPKIEFF